jgi:hypothetical protein
MRLPHVPLVCFYDHAVVRVVVKFVQFFIAQTLVQIVVIRPPRLTQDDAGWRARIRRHVVRIVQVEVEYPTVCQFGFDTWSTRNRSHRRRIPQNVKCAGGCLARSRAIFSEPVSLRVG